MIKEFNNFVNNLNKNFINFKPPWNPWETSNFPSPLPFPFRFERELRAKLRQKANQFQSEENCLMKAFKYFDLDANGKYLHIDWYELGVCEPEEFAKAIEKIGVSIGSKKDLETLFKYYDTDGSGALDYKEFSVIICGNQSKMDMPESKRNQFGQGLGYKN